MDKEKVCLVLGANGFVGSYLVEHLAKTPGMRVRAFDRFSRGPQFAMAPNIEVVKGDFFNDDDIRQALTGVDLVLHTFSATTPFVSDNNPYIDITDNLMRSVKIFELCVTQGVAKVGFVSSGGAVYGSLSEHKIASEADTPLPVSPYGINKLAIEYYLEYFKRKHGMPYVVYRLTNPYGPRQVTKNNQGAIPLFLAKIKNHETITIYGDGTSSRDYIYMDDAAAMIARSFTADSSHAVYNIGRGEQTSLNEILDELKQLSGTEVSVSYTEAPKTFLQSTGVTIDRYLADFGDQQFTSLHDGLLATIKASQ
ncbi:MAG TPA: NAD-dependent epimerase/dehydratase family protein [Candidatus Saccharimonadales bacterium]|nr:NAD-dependent epimerase/dehydratase family protein [Candidatus Saccharimonadales bacterium]